MCAHRHTGNTIIILTREQELMQITSGKYKKEMNRKMNFAKQLIFYKLE